MTAAADGPGVDPTRRATAWTCEPGWEPALGEELRRTLPEAAVEVLGSALVTTVGAVADEPAVAFAEQVLPDCEPVSAPSIARWAGAACERIVLRLDTADVPWRLHVFARPTADKPAGQRRADLVRERIVADLRPLKRKLVGRLTEGDDSAWRDGEALVQVCLATPEEGWISIIDAATRHRWRRCVSRYAAGRIDPAVDKAAPSRAFAKLVEVERRIGRRIAAGETCVDLGSSPGSWAYTALERGATVTAVDRSPLRADLMRHSRLSFVRGDAFAFEPPEPVDWLLSDVIAFPDRVREMLSAWLMPRRCRYFCVTVKFRGREQDAELEDVKEILRSSDYEFCIRRLTANKNEATAFGYLKSESRLQLC